MATPVSKKYAKKSLLKTKELSAKYKGTTAPNLTKDAKRKAKPAGKRVSASGNVYYEHRANRVDVTKRKTFPMLAEGGIIGEGKNTYVAFYKGKQVDVKADTSLAAQKAAAEHFKAKKSYDVTVVLGEKGGEPVVHSTSEFEKGGDVDADYAVYGSGGEYYIKDVKGGYSVPSGTTSHYIGIPNKFSSKKKAEIALENFLRKIKKEEAGQFAAGGSIPNNYEGKTAAQVWDSWSVEQRKHFIKDHMANILHEKDVEDLWEHYKGDFSKLPERGREEIEKHVMEGQYAKGGVTYKKYTIAYKYKNGFTSHIIIESISEEKALEKAKEEVKGAYGSEMFKDFTFEPAIKHKYADGGEITDDVLRAKLKENGVSDEDFANLTDERKEALRVQYFAPQAQDDDDLPASMRMYNSDEWVQAQRDEIGLDDIEREPKGLPDSATDDELHNLFVTKNGGSEEAFEAMIASPEARAMYEQAYLADMEEDHIPELPEGEAVPTPTEEPIVEPEPVIEEPVVTIPEHFGSGRNIDVFGYETKNFDICGSCVAQFERGMESIQSESDETIRERQKKALIQLATHVDGIFDIEKNVVAGSKEVNDEAIKYVTGQLILIGVFLYRSGLAIDTAFLGSHVVEITQRMC